MKKQVSLCGAALALVGGVCWSVKSQKSKLEKYHFLEEFQKKDFVGIPSFLFKPFYMNILNQYQRKQQGKLVEGVTRKALQIESFDKEKIQLYIYEPEDSGNEMKPCLVYYHGGGFIVDYMSSYHEILSNYAKMMDCKVVTVCYRTLITGTFETTLNDCYQTLLWAYENGSKYGWDPNNIAVGGDSAGGTLAAAIVRKTRDLKGPKICYQMLNYPCLDKTMSTESMRIYTDTPVWNATMHRKLFDLMMPSLDESTLPYFDMVNQTDFEGLCDAYIEVEQYDCLHDQGVNYAHILKEQGYEVTLNDMKGTFHAFDQNQKLNVSKDVMKLRCECVRNAFDKNKEGGK